MPVKKLIDAVVFGLGTTAGKRMFEELEEKVENEVDKELAALKKRIQK